ncbi:hypothetical protein [Drancourtella massiliensis]|uniref:hypothetical protein n=1 Tax=Drancourtella massiliensis TaxID=1632013 RepID=UPI00195E5E70|nr:hypothetical protein [Drancourtella massiliensis]
MKTSQFGKGISVKNSFPNDLKGSYWNNSKTNQKIKSKKNSIFNQLNYPGDLCTIKGEINAEKQNKTIKGFETVGPLSVR